MQFPASRRKTLFGETPNTTREDVYAPQTYRLFQPFLSKCIRSALGTRVSTTIERPARYRRSSSCAVCLSFSPPASVCLICGFDQKNLPHLLQFSRLKNT
jgi:hypothetical protein